MSLSNNVKIISNYAVGFGNIDIDAANKNNVSNMVLVGNDLESSKKVSALAEEFNFISTAFLNLDVLKK